MFHHANHRNDELDKTGSRATRRRSRNWERQHQGEKAVYRGLDLKFVQEVKRLASALFVPEGEAACSILKYSLSQYEAGFLDLVARSDPMRMRRTMRLSCPNYGKNPMKRKSKTSTRMDPSWRDITTWRNFSPELKRTISALASEDALNVPVGELVNALLRYGLQANRAGLLKLEANEKAVVLSLLEGDK